MPELGPIEPAFAALVVVVGAWAAIAAYCSWRAAGLLKAARAAASATRRIQDVAEASPAAALLVGNDDVVDTSQRLAALFGLARAPEQLGALLTEDGPFERRDAVLLGEFVARARATGAPFTLVARLAGSDRLLRVQGGVAGPAFAEGTLLLWFLDVTDSEARAEGLQAQLDRRSAALAALTGLIEAAPFPIWHRGPDLKLAMVNSAYVRAVEADDAARVVRDGIELIDEADGRSPAAFAAEVRDAQAPARRMLPATLAGARRTVEVVEVPLGPSGVAGFALDIDEREQARADLLRFVQAQRDMLDRLSAGVAQFGRDRALIFFNQPFARLFEIAPDFLADSPEFERVIDAMRASGKLPEVRDFPEWKAERRAWFTSGLAASEEDWLLPGGKHMRVVAQPLPDGGLLLIFEDRTEQIQLASARDTLLRVRTATFDNLFEAVGVFASDGRLHLWNNRFRELWQFEEETLARHPRVDALTPHIGRLLKKSSHATLVRELVRSATVERKQRSGRVSLIDDREFEFAAVPLPDGNALFTMLDVTDSRKVEAALRDRNEALEAADRLKTAFVSNMSYELRTPLTSIGGFAEMLAGGYAGPLEPTAAEYVKAILDSVARLSVLIDNVLDLTQSDSGSLLLAEEKVDVSAITRSVAEEIAPAAAARQVRLAVELPHRAVTVTGDPRRLGQAIGNILRNAVAYTDPGGRVLTRVEANHDEVTVTIADNGRGIAPAEQARVFDRFSRSAERDGGGDGTMGLGLPLARQFVEAHGGTLTLESVPGEGTTVAIRLPRTAAGTGAETRGRAA